MTPSSTDWLDLCRRATGAARSAVAGLGGPTERAVEEGRGEGGDTTLAVDRVAEEAIFRELEAFGTPLVAISEERGEVLLHGGRDSDRLRVVIDPVDGSKNAKHGLPFACVCIAVAAGRRMADVEVGYVAELDPQRDWWAVRGEGAFLDGRRLDQLRPGPLELLGLETAHPALVAAAADAIAATEAYRLRALGSIGVSMCLVAAGRLDAMVTLGDARSVDVAAAALIVEEAGGTVALPGGDALDMEMRSRAVAARSAELAERVLASFG